MTCQAEADYGAMQWHTAANISHRLSHLSNFHFACSQAYKLLKHKLAAERKELILSMQLLRWLLLTTKLTELHDFNRAGVAWTKLTLSTFNMQRLHA